VLECHYSLPTGYRIGVYGSLFAKNELDPFSRFDTIPACNRQTDRQTDRRRAIA